MALSPLLQIVQLHNVSTDLDSVKLFGIYGKITPHRKVGNMAKRFLGKTIIVTGAGSKGPGIGNGKAAAIMYAREGGKIFAVDIDSNAAAETKSIIDEEGGCCSIYQADISKSDEVLRMVNTCLSTYGKIDVLHNNVGILKLEGITDSTEEEWNRVMDVNVTGVYLASKNVLPSMIEQKNGVIINISSVAAIRYWGGPAIAYNTSKAAILQLTQTIALENARSGIRANCILPGVIDTPLIQPDPNQHSPEEIAEIKHSRDAMIPMGRMGEPWDVAKAALFLASDDAKYITGTDLIVDGGLVCNCIPTW